jgi:hypothetical protein
MGHRHSLATMGYVADAPYLYAWAEKIGQFIVNFGGIEILTYQYLAHLEGSQEIFDRNFDRLLADRIDRIVQLLPMFEGLEADQRARAVELWSQVRDLTKWRNRIAHNPVLPEWSAHKNREVDPPDRIGLPDAREFREGGDGDFISIDDLSNMVVASADISRDLHALIYGLRSEA